MHDLFTTSFADRKTSTRVQSSDSTLRNTLSRLHRIKNTLSAYLNGKIHITITKENEELKVDA